MNTDACCAIRGQFGETLQFIRFVSFTRVSADSCFCLLWASAQGLLAVPCCFSLSANCVLSSFSLLKWCSIFLPSPPASHPACGLFFGPSWMLLPISGSRPRPESASSLFSSRSACFIQLDSSFRRPSQVKRADRNSCFFHHFNRLFFLRCLDRGVGVRSLEIRTSAEMVFVEVNKSGRCCGAVMTAVNSTCLVRDCRSGRLFKLRTRGGEQSLW